MKNSKSKVILVIILIIIMNTWVNICLNNVNAITIVSNRKPANIAVFLYDFSDLYISLVKQNLENIQKENSNSVKFSFFDAKDNQSIQNESIDKALTENYDLFIINFVISKENIIEEILYKLNNNNIPVILYNEPDESLVKLIKDPNKAIFVSTNNEQSGILEGKIIVDKWNADRESIDKNGDGILQYVMLTGKLDSPVAAARTKYSIAAINDAGIKTENIATVNGDWRQELGRSAIESLFLKYNDKIEAIIANNDEMAIGAIEALQEYGYNIGDKSKTIAVVGVDAIPATQDLIKNGFMTGTVLQDPRATAEALYTVGMNLINRQPPLENTNYKFDDTGVTIRLPYQEYKSS